MKSPGSRSKENGQKKKRNKPSPGPSLATGFSHPDFKTETTDEFRGTDQGKGTLKHLGTGKF